MGVLHAKEGNPREAIKCYELPVEKEEPDAFIYAQLGKSYAELGNTLQAILYYNKAVMLNPPNVAEIQVCSPVPPNSKENPRQPATVQSAIVGPSVLSFVQIETTLGKCV